MCDCGSKTIVENRAFLPPRRTYPHVFRIKGETFPVETITTKLGNQIPYVHLPNSNSPLTLIYSHGNSTNLGETMALLHYYRQHLNVNVVGYDYTGYGRSKGGEASEKATFADICAVIDTCRKRGISEETLILFGKSLGSGPSCYAAARYNVRALVLESAFLSCLDVVFPSFLCSVLSPLNIFTNQWYIQSVRCPLLLIHGKKDNIVPLRHAQELKDKCPTVALEYYVNAGHNDILLSNPLHYIDVLRLFFSHAPEVVARFIEDL